VRLYAQLQLVGKYFPNDNSPSILLQELKI